MKVTTAVLKNSYTVNTPLARRFFRRIIASMSSITPPNGKIVTEREYMSEAVRDTTVISVSPLPAHSVENGSGNGYLDKALDARVEEKVAERTNDLRIANQQMETLIFAAAHDLRAPLRHM